MGAFEIRRLFIQPVYGRKKNDCLTSLFSYELKMMKTLV